MDAPKPAAFLFDMDGVIVNSTPLHVEAWRIYLAARGKDTTDLETKMLGLRNEELVGLLFGEHLDWAARQKHGQAKEALYRQMMAPLLEQHLVPGVREFLARNTATPCALVSNAERANIDFVLDQARLRAHFPVIVDGEQMERPKPFPDGYLRGAELLGVDVRQCVVFEDSGAGIAAGLASGAQVVGLLTTLARIPQAHLAIPHFASPELENWLTAFRPQ
jgi:beta-phosphoglucomutase